MAKKSRHQVALEERVQELKLSEQSWMDDAERHQKLTDQAETGAAGVRHTWEVLQSILDSVDSGEPETEEA